MINTRLIGGIALVLTALTVNADPIVDSADGTYLSDTDSGLDWLDVTVTAGLSFDEVESLISTGGTHNGIDLSDWSIATTQQLNQLVSNYLGIAVEDSFIEESGSLYSLIHMLSPTTITTTYTNSGAIEEYVAELRGFLDTTYVSSSGQASPQECRYVSVLR